MVVKILVPFGNTGCRIIAKEPKRDHNFDNHPCVALHFRYGPSSIGSGARCWHTHTQVCMYMYIGIDIFVYIYICIYTNTRIYTCIYANAYIYIHIYVYIYIYSRHVHTHTLQWHRRVKNQDYLQGFHIQHVIRQIWHEALRWASEIPEGISYRICECRNVKQN